jgi:2-C-methyl-D-erythritol 2,4-cyclodiphosphate synthase
MRVGLGYDIHPLAPGRVLILGGVTIAHSKGLVGHSDADALTHAVCDALLGAMGEGDLGTYFPSSNPKFKNISSLLLLEEVRDRLHRKGYELVNLDTVIIAQAPRLGPHLEAMRDRLAQTLQVPSALVNVKVKSGEGLDAVGREEAMATQAVCLIQPIPLKS